MFFNVILIEPKVWNPSMNEWNYTFAIIIQTVINAEMLWQESYYNCKIIISYNTVLIIFNKKYLGKILYRSSNKSVITYMNSFFFRMDEHSWPLFHFMFGYYTTIIFVINWHLI